ncbi:rhodanese-like domain-containing protein [Anaerocolumna sedimenticola]|uniref:Rhodanese-like domain-containing protein n=1 Tax=Anaerocolumna sedimenticola TaxID=2696063 RepID=A0A6P1TVS2_9FIRM|nr:rhodanese-like domain-containing protein [Anaerocolumna sedimenticola]QHQ63515.1 rhodanese-like domain-containing protein [Anaerocolumna sedimenticola]
MLGLLKKVSGKNVSANELDNLIGKADIIDIREPYEYKTGSIKTAKNIPMDNLINNPNQYLDKDKTYYIMCQSGVRSSQTCKFLSKQGFDVINVTGGISSYTGNN